jgi:steroid 5-alpha-reductase/3-oxo-5-alpha-steroid 4-dehydrogenase 1
MELIPSTPEQWHQAFVIISLALVPIVFGALLLLPAAYGRHGKQRSKLWGPGIPTRWSWVLMEFPQSVGFAVIFFLGDRALELVPLLLLALWQAHYIQRTFIFPFKIKVRPGDTTPIGIPLLAIATNLVISFLNASILSWSSIGPGYDLAWLSDPRFLIGVALFFTGYHVNRKADAMLAALRKPGETGYKIPRGWLYERITCPNYFGELLIWTGWAVATWSLAGLVFLLVTASNLVPRALTNHRWYHDKFPDYPRERRAIIPYVL